MACKSLYARWSACLEETEDLRFLLWSLQWLADRPKDVFDACRSGSSAYFVRPRFLDGPNQDLTTDFFETDRSFIESIVVLSHTGYAFPKYDIKVFKLRVARNSCCAASQELLLEWLRGQMILYLADSRSTKTHHIIIDLNPDGSWAVDDRRSRNRPVVVNFSHMPATVVEQQIGMRTANCLCTMRILILCSTELSLWQHNQQTADGTLRYVPSS
ncbi:hypothetical protein WJX79_000433 [Trebouxia sp. C0005]